MVRGGGGGGWWVRWVRWVGCGGGLVVVGGGGGAHHLNYNASSTILLAPAVLCLLLNYKPMFLENRGNFKNTILDFSRPPSLYGQFALAISVVGERGGVGEGINPSPQGLEGWRDWILKDSFSDLHALRPEASAD